MRITALSGGVGGARFLTGLLDCIGVGDEVTVVANTADDIILHGLRVCPDVDTVMYTLGGGIHAEQGWGRSQETFSVSSELASHGRGPNWFTLGDRDFATHIIRTQSLAAGQPLHEVLADLCQRWLARVPVRLLPMTDDLVQTHVTVDDPDGAPSQRVIHFQEWWVRYHASLPAHHIDVLGIENAAPAPGVLEAITTADVVVLPPSNPVVSIGPILSVAGVRDALRETTSAVVGVSPIIGTAPVRGMADACLRSIGVPTTPDAVAGLYADFLDGWLVHSEDADAAQRLRGSHPSIRVRAVPLLMSDRSATAQIAADALDLAGQGGLVGQVG